MGSEDWGFELRRLWCFFFVDLDDGDAEAFEDLMVSEDLRFENKDCVKIFKQQRKLGVDRYIIGFFAREN